MLTQSNAGALRSKTKGGCFHLIGILKLLVILLLLGLAVVPVLAEDAAYDDASGDDAGNADDDYVDLSGEDFDKISMMPVSCVN